jgi:hypothetical protein
MMQLYFDTQAKEFRVGVDAYLSKTQKGALGKELLFAVLRCKLSPTSTANNY